MTLLDIRNQLFSHFCKTPTFGISDFPKISLDKTLEDSRETLIRMALAEMVELGISKPVATANEPPSLWILSAPIGQAGQTISLSMTGSEAVATTIEDFFNAFEVEHDPVDKLNLNEGHIWQLIEIINTLSESE